MILGLAKEIKNKLVIFGVTKPLCKELEKRGPYLGFLDEGPE
jgi:hypothetical protein